MYGAFVRAIRESRDLSQGELADIAGIPQPNISAIENDRRIPSADTLNRLAVACGYQLTATAGNRAVRCALARGDWFPDDDLPPRLADDPPDEAPAVGAEMTMEQRGRVLAALLDAGELAVRSSSGRGKRRLRRQR